MQIEMDKVFHSEQSAPYIHYAILLRTFTDWMQLVSAVEEPVKHVQIWTYTDGEI